MSLSNSRKSVTTVLKKHLGNDKEAVNFEKDIYKMCQRLSKGEYDENTVEEIYEKYAYEKVGDIINSDGEEELNNIINDIKNLVLDWNSAPYKEFRERREEENKQVVQGVKTGKSDYQCKNKECGSREVIQTMMQTRSGDEGYTVFVTCLKCGRKDRFD